MGGHGSLCATLNGPAELVDAVALLVLYDPVLMRPLPPDQALVVALAEGARKRRTHFPSVAAARAAYRGRGVFKRWPDESLDAYLIDAFRPAGADASAGVRLTCEPHVEAAHFALRIDLLWSRLRHVRRPVVFVSGAESAHVPTDVLRDAAALVPGAGFVAVPRAEHCPQLEWPAESAALFDRAFRARAAGGAHADLHPAAAARHVVAHDRRDDAASPSVGLAAAAAAVAGAARGRL